MTRRFLPPLEAEVRMRLLYEANHDIINLIILVTPSRFRPPQHLHGESYEHPQNVFLSQVG